MVNRLLLVFLIGIGSLFAQTESIGLKPQNDEEALFLRRIAQFYEENEYELVEKEIFQYLEQYSESPFWYQLYGFLGDLSLNQGKYTDAIEAYRKVKDASLQKELALNYLLALLKNGDYDTLLSLGREFASRNLFEEETKLQKLYFFMGSSLYEIAIQEQNEAKRNSYALEAKGYFEKVQAQEHLFNTKERLAHIHSMLKENKEASTLYFDLAKNYPEHRERFMFQAALMQSAFEPEDAIETFRELSLLQGEFASEAALNRMILLFDTEQYSEALLIKDQLFEQLEEKHHPFLYFFVGKSHFMLEDFSRAAEAFKTYISLQEDQKGKEEKSVHLLYLSTAEKLEDLDLYSEALSLFSQKYPEDAQLVKAQLVKALLHKKKGDHVAALKDFHQIELSSFQDNRDLFYFEYGHLLHEMGEKEKSYQLFSSLVKEFPQSAYYISAWKYLANLSKDLEKEATSENQMQRKWQLVSDLKTLLSQENDKIFSSAEKRAEYQWLLASHLYDLKEYDQAKSFLLPIVDQLEQTQARAKAYLMLAWISQQLESSPERFCEYGEKALSLNKDLGNRADVHLALYNAYLSFDDGEKAENNFAAAAKHLYQVHQIDSSQVTEENLLWLVQLYYHTVTRSPADTKEELGKAIDLYGKTMGLIQEKKNHELFEAHVLNFSELLTIANMTEKKIQFLESLSSQYDYLPDVQWISQPKTYFELAKAYQQIDNNDLAKDYYEKVFQSHQQSLLKAEAILEHSKIALATISKEEYVPSNPDIRRVLGRLKSVALQKNILTEPVHLQAALEAIDLQCACESEMSPDKHLFLLDKLIENFSEQGDLLSKQYHEALEQNADKKKMFEVYMSLVEAEKEYWNSQKDQGEKEQAAQSLKTIRDQQEDLSTYLIERIDRKLETLSEVR